MDQHAIQIYLDDIVRRAVDELYGDLYRMRHCAVESGGNGRQDKVPDGDLVIVKVKLQPGRRVLHLNPAHARAIALIGARGDAEAGLFASGRCRSKIPLRFKIRLAHAAGKGTVRSGGFTGFVCERGGKGLVAKTGRGDGVRKTQTFCSKTRVAVGVGDHRFVKDRMRRRNAAALPTALAVNRSERKIFKIGRVRVGARFSRDQEGQNYRRRI